MRCNAIGQWGRQFRQSGRRTLLSITGGAPTAGDVVGTKPITNYFRYSGGTFTQITAGHALTPRITSATKNTALDI